MRSATTSSVQHLASQVEERGVVLKRRERKREICLRRVGVLESVPEGVAGPEERAANLVPVALGVLEGGDGRAGVGANWKQRLVRETES